MMKYTLLFLLLCTGLSVYAQDDSDEKNWEFGGALGLDFSQMLFVNPKFGAGEDRIGVGGNTSFFANYKDGRTSWNNAIGLTFGVQRLGRFGRTIPFQKSVDELRLSSNFSYGITEESPFGYSLDFLFVSQLTPTYEGNLLSALDAAVRKDPIAQFFSPATITIAPGISFKKQTDYGLFTASFSPAALKLILVSRDDIAQLGLHGNPFSKDVTREAFVDNWGVQPTGALPNNGGFYANNYLQLGASLQAGYKHQFFGYTEKDKDGKEVDKHRLHFKTNVSLYSNYLRLPQHVDVEWITNVDLFLFKGLSLSLMTNVFWDYDIFVQVDTDNDVTTGDINGFDDKGRRVSFLQTLLIKYSIQF